MLDRIMRSRVTASAAVAGLTLGLVWLTGLALWSNQSAAQATAHIRAIDEVSGRWDAVFLDLSFEYEALNDYLRAQTDVGRQPLVSALGSARADLEWLRGRPQEAARARTMQDSYDAYTATLKTLVKADGRGQQAKVALYAEQASLGASSLRKQTVINVARQRLEMDSYLEGVEHRAATLRAAATISGVVDCLLAALCAAVLLSHQRRMRRAVSQSRALTVELSAEKSLLASVISSIPQLVYWKDDGLRFVGCNQALLDFRGLPDVETVIGQTEQTLEDLENLGTSEKPETARLVLADIETDVLRTGTAVVDHKVTASSPTGQPHILLVSVLPHPSPSGRVAGVIGVAADVTEISQLERQLAQATRLESIGQLAAGVAHEINTPVQFVSDNIRFVSESLPPVMGGLQRLITTGHQDPCGHQGEIIRAVLDDIDLEFISAEVPDALTQSLDGLARVTQIVRALKDFSHPGQGRADCDLNRAVESTVQVSRNEWKTRAELELDLDPQVGQVPCYEGELKQALLNIIVNAAQAIGEQQARAASTQLGHIRVTTRRDGENIRISIADDGPGMDATTRDHLFDPFFTTKEVGKGTGQGLSLAHASVVNKHHGTIDVESAPGAGATFVITVPHR